MVDPINNSRIVEFTTHPSTIPLSTFHGHIVKIFSPLPSEGKFLEIVKRVILAVIAPFAYLLLAFVALVGYPYTESATKERPAVPNELGSAFIAEKSLATVEQSEGEMQTAIEPILTKYSILKIKYLIKCEIDSGKRFILERDISVEDGLVTNSTFQAAVKEDMERIQKWFVKELEAQGLKARQISGSAFCLDKDGNVYCALWSVTDSSTNDSIGIKSSHSKNIPQKKHLIEYLKGRFAAWNIPFPKAIQSVNDFFQHSLVIESTA